MPAPEVNLWLPGIGVPRVNDLQLESSLRSLNLIWCIVKRFTTRKGKKFVFGTEGSRKIERNKIAKRELFFNDCKSNNDQISL